VKPDQKYRLAPWCYFKGEQISHDFKGVFTPVDALSDLLDGRDSVTENQAVEAGVSTEIWRNWIDNTYIVPDWKN